MQNMEILIPITLFIVVGFLLKTAIEHKTMRTLINRGDNIGNLNELLKNISRKSNASSSMKWGLIFVGVGVAFIVAMFFPRGMQDEMTVSFMFILAGFGLIAYYYFWGNRENDKDSPA
ncbi:MAG: hypothetical protein DWQ05_20545 [Calditrichaeota bacterium]|nr:MAG: hypothetical protein DWQ05_20545 [Calditrichota bacterium]